MILALGTASGRKSSSQNLPEPGSVQVFFAEPFNPWTAIMLVEFQLKDSRCIWIKLTPSVVYILNLNFFIGYIDLGSRVKDEQAMGLEIEIVWDWWG
jgi:hypothetical protein